MVQVVIGALEILNDDDDDDDDHKKDLQEGGETTLATGAGVAFLQRRLHTTRTVLSLSMMLDCLMCVCRIITKIMDRWMDSSCTHQG